MYVKDRDSDLIHLEMVPFRNNSWPASSHAGSLTKQRTLAPSDREVEGLVPTTYTDRNRPEDLGRSSLNSYKVDNAAGT